MLILLNDFYKLLRGNTIFTINFKEKSISSDNVLSILKKIFPSNKVSFFEIAKVELQEKSISWRQQWYQLVVFDKDSNSIVLTDFSKVYPESLIASKVKFLIEVIIWAEIQNTNLTV